MNFNSVTGKSWNLKKFDNKDLNFFKDNFFLDEITSKLLAIRKIDKENVKNFLNPTIKNILPNPFKLKGMDLAIERTFQSIIKKEKIRNFWRL